MSRAAPILVHGAAARGRAPSFWQRRILTPLADQLRQGVSAESLALALALGFVLGVFPVVGTTTALCAVAGVWLRLNQPVLQLVNYFVYPLQIALLIPFFRAGEWLFRSAPVPIASASEVVDRFRASPWQFTLDYGAVVLQGIAVWTVLALPLAALVYLALRPLMRRFALALRA